MGRRSLLLAVALLLCLVACRQEVPPTASAPRQHPLVYTTSYPLFYFVQRIASNQIEAVFPAPAKEDPAFWRPSKEVVREYQGADLILLNGAEFEKWVPTTTLPLGSLADTSVGFKNEWIMFPEVITHSHGPQGPHSHGNIDFNTWLDPILARKQVEAVEAALERVLPGKESDLRQHAQTLRRDLDALDHDLRAVSAPLSRPEQRPLLASHPVYGYLARRYHWNLASVHWEPDEPVAEAQWKDFDALRARHPATVMIWEEEPLPTVRAELEKRGIRPVPFWTCGNRPPKGDYLQAMHENVERLRLALEAK